MADDLIAVRDGRTVTLRAAVRADAPALAALWRSVHERGEGVARTLAEFDALGVADAERSLDAPPGSLRITAEAADGTLAGEVTLWRETGERLRHAAVLGISVRPGWQGTGLGRLLMSAAMGWARTSEAGGLRRVELTVMADNTRARALYAAFGFAVEGVRRQAVRRADGTYADYVIMAALAPFPAPDAEGEGFRS